MRCVVFPTISRIYLEFPDRFSVLLDLTIGWMPLVVGMSIMDIPTLSTGSRLIRLSCASHNSRRALTIDLIRKLSAGLGLSEHCLIQEYALDTRQHA
jgi:hypothetical protein